MASGLEEGKDRSFYSLKKKRGVPYRLTDLFFFHFFPPDTMLLPVWNHPTEVVAGAPVPQATACANPGQIAVTYVIT